MAIVLFFGLCFFVLSISTLYVAVVIRHHLEVRRNAKQAIKAEGHKK